MIDNKEPPPAPCVGPVDEVRASPDRLRIARRVPEQFINPDSDHPERHWLAVYFIEHVGLTVELLADEQVAGWDVVGIAERTR